ncbi:MAG: Rid family hydrolase [Dehalococcoidia bacterium]|jgi:enamine deaminase RidA (YjgF/YER057c/UK114 family)|nr:Rid family hydrolase [Dehalococcoidia bacterium]MDP6226174.1 Rid family hydrolase [Dehalococcoidia bacterium]MDP7085181.1 Rid family hydrolase [Dehalococcoidia bacterium]MDP7200954.1 Rid family hydrolase [Dehalococcoidia bacterium]MDP7509573.1 Rid family hydrolase [Dehalococcoidia bacterium]
MERRIINPWTWQDRFGYVQANEVSGVQRRLICAGQTATDADGKPVCVGDMAGQIDKAIDNLETVLREAGFSLSDVVRLNYYTTDVDLFFASARASGRRLAAANCRPASTLLGVVRLASAEFMIELEATAEA